LCRKRYRRRILGRFEYRNIWILCWKCGLITFWWWLNGSCHWLPMIHPHFCGRWSINV
jgi:hypothetical protein